MNNQTITVGAKTFTIFSEKHKAAILANIKTPDQLKVLFGAVEVKVKRGENIVYVRAITPAMRTLAGKMATHQVIRLYTKTGKGSKFKPCPKAFNLAMKDSLIPAW